MVRARKIKVQVLLEPPISPKKNKIKVCVYHKSSLYLQSNENQKRERNPILRHHHQIQCGQRVCLGWKQQPQKD